MAQNKAVFKVMVVGLSESEMVVVNNAIMISQTRSKAYQLAHGEPLEMIQIVLIASDHPQVMEKWKEIYSRRKCPPTIYVCKDEYELIDLDMDMMLTARHSQLLSSICTRPLRSTRLLELFDQVTSVKNRSSSRQSFPRFDPAHSTSIKSLAAQLFRSNFLANHNNQMS